MAGELWFACCFALPRHCLLQRPWSGDFIGTGAGVLGGVLVAANIDTIVPFIERLIGTQILSADVYLITELPSKIIPSDVISIGVISLLLSLVATLYPSWRASKVNPAEALRYE